MRVQWGICGGGAERGREVVWDTTRTINPHCIVLGETGAGKTHQLRKMIGDMGATGENRVRFHIFDSHGDIEVPGASSVRYSESTDYGLNPLEVSPDPDFGGVRKRVQSFVSAINRTSHKLGHRQEAVLRKLLGDLYSLHGFAADDPSTWHVDSNTADAVRGDRQYLEVPFEEKDKAKAAGARWCPDASAWWVGVGQHSGELLRWGPKQFGKRHPTVLDAVRFARNRHRALFLGANNATMRMLGDVNRLARQLRAKEQKALKAGDEAWSREAAEKEVEAAKAKTIEAFALAVNAVKSGRELDDLIKFDSSEVLGSVLERLENLYAIGIFRSTPAPFGARAPIWRRDIVALSDDEKRLFVTFELEALFAEAVRRGPTSSVRDVVVIDEADLYTSDDPDHILNRLIKEARKYGLALILASQSPTHFSDEMLSGVAVRVFIGMDRMHWAMAQRKLGVGEASLGWIIPRQRGVVQMKQQGRPGAPDVWVDFTSRPGGR